LNDKLINVLHISDFHFSKSKARDQKVVIDALIKDLESNCIGSKKPDLIIFSGDLVNSGDNDCHLSAADELIEKVKKATQCNDERIFIAPGNHDASRKYVEDNSELHKKLRRKSNDKDFINEFYKTETFITLCNEKFANFNDVTSFYSEETLAYDNPCVRIYSIEEPNVDIIIVNSALLTATGLPSFDNDRGKLAVPEHAILDALEHLRDDSIKICTMHHPISYFSESCERLIKNILERQTNLHLYGHMHEAIPEKTSGLIGEVITSQSGAIYTNRDDTAIGYSILTIEPENRFIECSIRGYFPTRDEFDQGFTINKNPVFYSSEEAKQYFTKLVKPIDLELLRNALSGDCFHNYKEEIDNGAIGQGVLLGNFVEPPLQRQVLQSDLTEKRETRDDKNYYFNELVHGRDNVILYAAAEHGRTTVLYEVQRRLFCESSESSEPLLPVIIDFEEIKYSMSALQKLIKSRAIDLPSNIQFNQLLVTGNICLLVDDLDYSDEKKVGLLTQFMNKFPKIRYIFSTLKRSAPLFGAHEVFEGIAIDFEHLELCELRRQQMRQLVTNYNEDTGTTITGNVETILDRIQSEIEGINLPFTAANGSILFTVFQQKSQFKPINRSVLIEQFIDITLSKGSPEQVKRDTFDFRNKTALLAYIAGWMAKEDTYIVEIEQVRTKIVQYIDNLGLTVDVDELLREFLITKIFVKKSAQQISFRYRAVLEYFISEQMKNVDDFKTWIMEEDRYLKFVNEIQYFAGSLRNDLNLLNKIGNRFQNILDNLEEHIGQIDLKKIDSLVLPHPNSSDISSNFLISQLEETPLTQEERDKELEGSLPVDAENRQEVFRPEIKNTAEEFTLALFMYSGVLKNMELVSDHEKRKHLERIWVGWCIFLHFSLVVAVRLAKERKVRINGVLYQLNAPKGISNEALTRLICLNLPKGISNLVSTYLGTEKLEKQLLEPSLIENGDILVIKFFITSLIGDLRLQNSALTLKQSFKALKSSSYLTEAMAWKIIELRKKGDLQESDFKLIMPELASALASLSGGTAESRANLKRKTLAKLNKEGVQLKLMRNLDKEN